MTVRRLGDLSHAELAMLTREYLLAGHLIDRAGMPHLIGPYGREGMQEIAIDEWMGASPVYTRRMQRALRFAGTDVATIFKGMQLDVGAPPQFMDFRYQVHGFARGEFHLDSCGALLDVEPMGDDFVTGMCHHIEDPTFDATACATNPRARMTPVHRPPRTPADRHPHCHWLVEIDPSVPALPEPTAAVAMAGTLAAQLEIPPVLGQTPAVQEEGWRVDYSGPLDPDLQLEDFTADALLTIAQEACLQGHLLVLSFVAAIAARHGEEAAARTGHRQFLGIAGVAASRLARAFGLDAAGGLDDIATLLELHPAFHPRAYVGWEVDRQGDRLLLFLGRCAALDEAGVGPWPRRLLADADAAALNVMVQAVDPCARVIDVSGGNGGWEVVIGDEPADEPSEVVLTRFSTGADFVFEDRTRPLEAERGSSLDGSGT